MSNPAPSSDATRTGSHSLRLLLVMAAIAFVVTEATYHAGALSGLDQAYSDLWHRVSGVRYTPKHTALVVIDEESLNRYRDDPLVFWAPLHAKAIATLREAGATVIGIDFLFSITPENWLKKFKLSKNKDLQQFDLAFRQELNSGKVVLVGAIAHNEGKPDDPILPDSDYLLSLPNMDLVSGIGLADLLTDKDGAIRRFRIAPPANWAKEIAPGAPRLSFSALMAVRASGQSPAVNDWSLGGFGYTSSSVHNISYAGPQGTIPRVSFFKLLEKNALNDPSVKALHGKVVIIGGDYLGMNDMHSTPYGNSVIGGGMPGPEIQANIVETLLSGRTTSAAPDVLRWIITALVLLAAIIVGLRTSPWWGLGAVIVGALLALAAGYASLQKFWLFPTAHLQLGLLTGFLLVLGLRLTREERDKARIRNMFEGYVSDDVVNMLLSSGQKLDMGGQSMHITILFSDIRNFTTITEKLSAHETVEFLNVYFERVINVIRAEGGRIDKFIGDAVMAEFGVPYPFADHPARALRAAAGIRQVAEEFKAWMRNRFPGKDLPEFRIGVGVHTGNAVVGNLGSAKRMEFTAIGDTVNVASRLESETKNLSCVIVASAETVRAAGHMVVTGRHDNLTVKGRAEPIEIYEILDIRM
ncbi:MAG: adenylate/guanylate cyclase domain-containing protein [Burkholderiales bacterium]